jgi:hypothetical protein
MNFFQSQQFNPGLFFSQYGSSTASGLNQSWQPQMDFSGNVSMAAPMDYKNHS